jgi:flagellar biosynthetic protein FliR
VASESFSLGMRLAAPLVVFSLVLNVALGLLNKLVPQMQVFFVGMPIQILVGLMVLMIALPPVMLLFMQFMGDGIAGYLAPE